MNDYSDIGLLKRSFRDVHAVVSRLDTQMRRLIEPAAIDRPGGLVARAAACHLLAKWERRGAEDVARQHFARDNDLHHLIRAASGPAMTGVAGWAAELAAVTVADIATNLLPQSVLTQLRAASGQPYTFVEGSVVKVPIHSPIASGSFVAEGDPIKVGALILTALTLKPKKAPSILAITKELLAGSPLNIELWLRTTLQEDLRLAIDAVLLGNGAATAASPAGLLNGVTPLTATAGGGSTAMLGDVKKLMAATAPNLKPVMIVGTGQQGTIGILEPPIGVPAIVAPYLPADQIIMIDASAFASAIGGPHFEISDEATVHMNDTPLPIATGAQGAGVLASPTQSLWQTACIGMKCLLDADWLLRRTGAVATITGVTW